MPLAEDVEVKASKKLFGAADVKGFIVRRAKVASDEAQINLLDCRNVRFDGMIVLLPVPMAVRGRPNDAGMGWPARRSRAGLGSNKSRWLGPPSRKRKMQASAFRG